MMPPRLVKTQTIPFPEEISSIAFMVYLVLRNTPPMPSSSLRPLETLRPQRCWTV